MPGKSGGARVGAGRKPKIKAAPLAPARPAPTVSIDVDMLGMLQAVALGYMEATPLQVRAAIAAVQYTHTRRSDGGKKDEATGKAAEAAKGRFAAAAPPKLVAVKR